ncbi:hypothetical protein CR513_42848, partial [Mucuna pruriens]
MDLDDLEVPGKVPSRVSKFAPKSSKLKPKPKSEPQPSISKPEPQELVTTVKKNEDGGETVASIYTKPELIDTVKMDVEPKSEAEDESRRDDPMDEDSAEDTVVREIDVFFSPSIDAETQYPLRPCWRPYELDEQCEEVGLLNSFFGGKRGNHVKSALSVRFKPNNSEVQIDFAIDLESNNIDREFANKYSITKQ